ncbi:hypothetical protein F4804DRAFT_305456 [Jackrogersella minutella]|nr:hypothetical protein F4804DRAFT_305456 [Jackrogersella minutella]
MEEPPFQESQELCKELESNSGVIRLKFAKATPATGPAIRTRETLPGDPRVELTDTDKIRDTLQEELMTERLNELASHFWLMTTQSSKNIRPLTEQLVQGRAVTLTEMPGLHLVWINNRVFVKPLPKYLLSHVFWKHYLLSDDSPIEQGSRRELLQAARGFLRSYAYLIQHESDFRLATEEETKRLIPKNISYTDFAAFIVRFIEVDDKFVSPRYRVGELRLARLNFWSKVLVSKAYYSVKWEYAAYFAQFFAPLLFVFGVFSLLISAMQLTLAVRTILGPSDSWLVFARVAHGLAIFTIFVVACVIATLILILVALVAREIIYALKDLYRRYKKRQTLKDQENQGDRKPSEQADRAMPSS